MSAVPSRASREPRHPRLAAWLPWIAGLVFVAGVAAVLIAYNVGGIRNTAHPDRPVPGNQPAQVPVKRVTVKPAKQALSTIIKFVDTAVARKNLAASWPLTAPALRQGFTLRQWKTGNIPVQYFPVWKKGAGYSPYQVKWSYNDEVMLQVLLVPEPGKGVANASTFWVGAKLLGADPKHRSWRVFYFAPRWYPPQPATNG